jgi:hypothetical protein
MDRSSRPIPNSMAEKIKKKNVKDNAFKSVNRWPIRSAKP